MSLLSMINFASGHLWTLSCTCSTDQHWASGVRTHNLKRQNGQRDRGLSAEAVQVELCWRPPQDTWHGNAKKCKKTKLCKALWFCSQGQTMHAGRFAVAIPPAKARLYMFWTWFCHQREKPWLQYNIVSELSWSNSNQRPKICCSLTEFSPLLLHGILLAGPFDWPVRLWNCNASIQMEQHRRRKGCNGLDRKLSWNIPSKNKQELLSSPASSWRSRS